MDIERELQRLKDVEAIIRLRSLYCYYADLKDCDNWANLFTEDGVFETDVFGIYKGRETIRALQHLPFAVHYVMNPIIDVDGDRASGKWLLFEPCSFPIGKSVSRSGAWRNMRINTGASMASGNSSASS